MALTLVEAAQCFGQQGVAHRCLFGIGHHLVLQRRIVLQHVLPLAFAFLVERDVQRSIAAHHHPAVHVDHFGL
jgi:hypothetical protein